MIVDELYTTITDERVERSARLRWVGGEFRLRVEVPAAFAPPEEDATAFMLAALPLALYRGEDLHVDGLVSALTLRQTERIQAMYAAWDPAARRGRVRAAGEAPVRAPPPGRGCLLSRGVDSLYSATAAHAEPLTHLVFCDTLTPLQSDRVRARELRLVATVSALIGLPLLRLSTNLRDPGAQAIDYQDMHGAGIAFMAHSLSGGLGRIVVPSGLTDAVLVPAGSHPLLDPLFASEWLAFDHHGLGLGRPGKVAELVARRPELLPYLKVCFDESSVGNCGRCRKCLWTMIALRAAGGLRQASLFPDEIDPALIARLRIPDLALRLFWMQAAETLGDTVEERRIRAAVRHALRRSARPSMVEWARGSLAWIKGESERPAPYWSASPSGQFRHMTNVSLAALRAGVPYPYGIESASPQPVPAWSVGPLEPDWAPPPHPPPSLVGLLRLLDRRGRRHRYAAGAIPPLAGVERVGELGALLREPGDGAIPVWLTPDGRLRTRRYCPSSPGLDPRIAVRWVLAPVRWRDLSSSAARCREVLRRALDVLTARAGDRVRAGDRAPRPGPEPPVAELSFAELSFAELPFAELSVAEAPVPEAPVGYLYAEAGAGRLPLLSAIHPVTGDQLLSTDARTSTDLGYNAPTLIGYLRAAAPASGTLGCSRPVIPWASRFGQRASAT